MESAPGSTDTPAQVELQATPSESGDLARRKLCEIAGIFGRSLLDEPQRCEAMLRDLCPDERRDVFLLAAALKERIPVEIIASLDTVPEEALISKLTRKLCDHLGLAPEAARWAVDSWLLAARVMASVRPSASSSSGVAQAAAAADSGPVPLSLERATIESRAWFFLCAGVILCAAAALFVVATVALHHAWSTFGGWLANTAIFVVSLGAVAGAQTWLAAQFRRSSPPRFRSMDGGRLAWALLIEVLVLLSLPATPVGAVSIWGAEWAAELHWTGQAHDLSFHLGRILQSLPLGAFLFQWTRSMIDIQGTIAASMVRRS